MWRKKTDPTTNGPKEVGQLAKTVGVAVTANVLTPYAQNAMDQVTSTVAKFRERMANLTATTASESYKEALATKENALPTLTNGVWSSFTDVLRSSLDATGDPEPQKGAFSVLTPRNQRIFHISAFAVSLAVAVTTIFVDRFSDKFTTHVYFSSADHSPLSPDEVCVDTHRTWEVDPIIFAIGPPSLVALFSMIYFFRPYYMSSMSGESSNWMRWLELALVGAWTVALSCMFCGIGDLGYILLFSFLYLMQPMINYVLEWTHTHIKVASSSQDKGDAEFASLTKSEWALFAISRLPALVVITLLSTAIGMNASHNPDLPAFALGGVIIAVVMLALLELLVLLFAMRVSVFRTYINVNFLSTFLLLLMSSAFTLDVMIGGALRPGNWFGGNTA